MTASIRKPFRKQQVCSTTALSLSNRRLCTLAAVATLAGLATGCAGFHDTAAPNSVAVPAMSGKVHGGQQPIFNSTVGLYVAGSTGYGLGSSNLLTVPVSSAADGSFTISGDYHCPSSSSLVYLTATGGDPTGNASTTTNNTAIKLVAALGACGNLSAATFVQVNELTTAAAAFALGQFFTPTYGAASSDGFGAPTTNQAGLTNAFATAPNLVSPTTGTATPTSAATGTNFYLSANDQSKVSTIGDILAACVNTTSATSSPCTTLFAGVTPTYAPLSSSTAATAATDILQAAVYMSLNPTSTNASGSNMATLYMLATAAPPFQPTLAAAPTDWTLAVNYTGTGINYLSSAAVDANGDLWFSNTNTTGGVVMLNGGTGKVGGTAGVTGGVIGFYSTLAGVTANGTRQVAIDQNGYAWFGGYSTYYLFQATGGVGVTATFPLPSGPTLPYAIAVDSANNVFATTGSTQIVSVSGTAASGTTATSTASLQSASAGLAITPGKVGYAANNGNGGVYSFSTSALTAGSCAACTYSSGTVGFYGDAVDANGKIWLVNKSGNTLTTLSGTTFTGSYNSGCLNTPEFIAVDGNNNLWVANNSNTTVGGNAIDTVCEYNNAGTLLSNTTGFGPHSISSGRGIAVDRSGNVWVTSYATGSSNVTEIVGAAVPVVTPISAALANNTVGTRP